MQMVEAGRVKMEVQSHHVDQVIAASDTDGEPRL